MVAHLSRVLRPWRSYLGAIRTTFLSSTFSDRKIPLQAIASAHISPLSQTVHKAGLAASLWNSAALATGTVESRSGGSTSFQRVLWTSFCRPDVYACSRAHSSSHTQPCQQRGAHVAQPSTGSSAKIQV